MYRVLGVNDDDPKIQPEKFKAEHLEAFLNEDSSRATTNQHKTHLHKQKMQIGKYRGRRIICRLQVLCLVEPHCIFLQKQHRCLKKAWVPLWKDAIFAGKTTQPSQKLS